jgi:hypothetical protein
MDIRFTAWAGYQLAPCDTTSSGIGGYGSIQLEPSWQLISIPIRYGYWDSTAHEHVHDDVTVAKFENYVLDQIDDLYGSDNVEVANTYPGDLQAFLSYVPGSTPTTSPHNFQMVYADGSHFEISGFWIKMTTTSGIVITWGEDN